MGLITDVTKHLEVPGEPDQSIDIRMISWLTLDKARKIRSQETLAALKLIGEIKLPKVEDESPSNVEVDRLTFYDRLTLLKHGVVGWSYPQDLDVEKFTEPTAKWAAREVLDYSLPTERQSKAVSSPSTGT